MSLSARISLACSVILMVAVGGIIFLQYPPGKSSFYPQCQLYRITGLYCPGCGSTRCLYAMIHGQFVEATRQNIIAFVALPIFGIYAVFWSWAWLLGKPVRKRWNTKPWLVAGIITLLIAFGILRNLPWSPFIFLAPH